MPFITTFNRNNPKIYSTIKFSVNCSKNNNVSGFHNIKLMQRKRQSPSLKITFKLKKRFTCDSSNLIYVVICDTCKQEYIRETGKGKTKLRDRVRVYRQHTRQPQNQQLKAEGHLRKCGNGEFRIFPLLQMCSQDTNLRRRYETRLQQIFKTKIK